MAVREFPVEVLRDLLINIDGDISAASPFAFLITGDLEGSLDPHIPWLEEHGLLDTPSEQHGRLALLPSLRRSLDIAARPIRRIVVSQIGPEDRKRSVHVSDGAEVVVAAFDEKSCILSDPLEMEAFRDTLVEVIGPASESDESPAPLQLHPAVLAFLGAVAGPWVPADDLVSDVEDLDSALEWPVERTDAEARLATLLGGPDAATEVLDSLVEDQILETADGKFDIHPAFQVWHRAIRSGVYLEIRRQEFPQGDLAQLQAPVHGLFLGSPGGRCMLWPAGNGSEEILLSHPTAEELKSVVGYLVGWIDSD